MAWNEPSNNNNQNNPPDLDEALKKMQRKLKAFFGDKKKASSTGNGGGADETPNMGFIAGIIGLIVLVIWGLSGIFIVGPAEQAAVLRFGKYVKTVGAGPHWIPSVIESKVILNVEKVSDYSYSAKMLTKDENIVSVSVAVQYRIGDLGDYLFNVSDPQESLQQATASALRQVVGHSTLNQIIAEGREVWGASVEELLVRILDQYQVGILISSVSPQPARAPQEVQDAFDDAINAQEDEKRFKEQAFAYEAQVVPIAQGRAKRINEAATAFQRQVILNAQGEVAEFLAVLPEFTKEPALMKERLYLETMQKVFSSSSKIVVETKSGNMMYLPLEKLLNRPAQSIKPPLLDDASADNGDAGDSSSSSSLTTSMNDDGSTIRTASTRTNYRGRGGY